MSVREVLGLPPVDPGVLKRFGPPTYTEKQVLQYARLKPAREGEAVAVSAKDMAEMTAFANNHGTVEDWAVWCRIRAALTTHPAAPSADKLREALTWALAEIQGDTRYENDGQREAALDQALAALKAEGA